MGSKSHKLIIFDLDGTLVDSSQNITNAINFVRSDTGLPPMEKAFITKTINRDDINPAEVFYQTTTFSSRQKELFESFYFDACDIGIAAYEMIPDMLEKLKMNGFSLAVATNGTTKFADKILSSLGLTHFFDIAVGADMVDSPKPCADMLHLVMAHYENASFCATPFMVGDSVKDIKSAKNAGIRSAFVKWGFTSSVDGAHIELGHASELEQLMGMY
jgi:phosphoglycolate phosphatase